MRIKININPLHESEIKMFLFRFRAGFLFLFVLMISSGIKFQFDLIHYKNLDNDPIYTLLKSIFNSIDDFSILLLSQKIGFE